MLVTLIIFCAKYLVYFIVAAAAIYIFFAEDKKRYLIALLSVAAITYIVGKLLSFVWYDPLPFVVGNFTPLIPHEANNGFPSDHSLLSGALASAVFLFDKRWGTALWCAAVLVGVARIAAGLHHPIDIIAAFGTALLAASLVSYVLQRSRRA